MDIIVYSEATCSKCEGELTFCWLIDKNGLKHNRVWCQPCNFLAGISLTKSIARRYELSDKETPRYITLGERDAEASNRKACKGLNPNKYIPAPLNRERPQKPQGNSPEYVQKLCAMPYKEYLQTHHWRSIREKAIKAAKNACQLCNSRSALQVHHRTYERRGCERLSDLTVLCRDCHAGFHGKSK